MSSAGTVSKILWHFTGGPNWDEEAKAFESNLKPDADAYAALKGILKSRQLRLSSYREVFASTTIEKAVLPEEFERLTADEDELTREPRLVITGPYGPVAKQTRRRPMEHVCCLAEIPVQHLPYHAERYGRFAIGFHRSAALDHGFRPVFYALQDDWVAQTFERLGSYLYGNTFLKAKQEALGQGSGSVAKEMAAGLRAMERLQRLLAFVKTFKEDQFDTVYCEREWRSTEQFNFELESVVMVVLPREFMETLRADLPAESAALPVLAWGDLLEH